MAGPAVAQTPGPAPAPTVDVGAALAEYVTTAGAVLGALVVVLGVLWKVLKPTVDRYVSATVANAEAAQEIRRQVRPNGHHRQEDERSGWSLHDVVTASARHAEDAAARSAEALDVARQAVETAERAAAMTVSADAVERVALGVQRNSRDLDGLRGVLEETRDSARTQEALARRTAAEVTAVRDRLDALESRQVTSDARQDRAEERQERALREGQREVAVYRAALADQGVTLPLYQADPEEQETDVYGGAEPEEGPSRGG